MKMFSGNELIAESKIVDGNKYLYLNEDAKSYPIDLFGFPDNKRKRVDMFRLIKWMETRACPPERCGIETILSDLNLKKYDAVAIARSNDFQSIADDFRLEYDSNEEA